MTEHGNSPEAGETPVFRLGLTLAGAVSAGAYSAGVLDFLREALEAWEAAKQNGGKDSAGCTVPSHQVQIQAISGTSAGAMCAAMFIGGLDKPLLPIRSQAPATAGTARSNPLYHAWVSRVDIQPMLDDDDLVASPSVKSLLNCRILDEIAGEVLNPWRSDYELQPWLAPAAEIFLCTTSLRGIPYAVRAYANDPSPYGMNLHSGVLKYRLTNTIATATDDALPLAPDAPLVNWENMRSAALASGAFPFALKARQTLTPRPVIDQRRWEIPTVAGRYLAGNIDSELPVGMQDFPAICVDGGAINNEPVEHARLALALMQRRAAQSDIPRLDRNLGKASAATILIDPFPDQIEFDPDYTAKLAADDVLSVAKALLPAMLNQLRFKSEELILATTASVGSRYLISPSRSSRRPGEPTLACGELGGFIGFLDESFRHHDYLLGRLNCQRFLKRHFYVAHDNPVIAQWVRQDTASYYLGETYYSGEELAQIATEHPDLPGLRPIPVIPLMPELRSIGAILSEGSSQPVWPSTYPREKLDQLHRRLRNRLDAVFTRLIEKLKLPIAQKVGRWLLSGVATLFRINPASIAAKTVINHIEAVLKKAGMLERPQ